MRAAVLAILVACATPAAEVRYTATYAGSPAQFGARFADAVRAAKLEVAQVDLRRLALMTYPIRLDPDDQVETGFLVTFQREGNYSMTGKSTLTVVVTPKAFEPGTDHALDDDKLPASAEARAHALLDHIRATLRQFEAPR